MKPGHLIELTKSQTQFVATPDTPDSPKAVAFVAGFGSGKTFCLVLKMVIIKLKYPNADVCYICPVFSMMRDILIPTLDELLLNTNVGYKVNKTTGEVLFDKGGRIIVKSADDPSKIIGFNVVAVFLDELDTIQAAKAKDVWIKSIARARKAIPILDQNGNIQYDNQGNQISIINQLFVATTPEGYRFVYDRFKKNKPDNYVLIQASTRENTHLPSDFVSNLEAIYPKELVAAYLDGQFLNMKSGTVYSYFNRETCSTNETFNQKEPIHVGVDFNVLGISAPVYVKRASLDDQGLSVPDYNYNHVPTLHSVKHFQKIKDTPELIETIKQNYPNSHVTIYPDASGNSTSTKGATVSDISLLRQAGFKCKFPKKNPAIMSRVLSANSAFKNGIVKINVNLCPDLAEAFEQQIYDTRTELPEKTSGAGTIDDITDSGTYIINQLYPIKRNAFRSSARTEG